MLMKHVQCDGYYSLLSPGFIAVKVQWLTVVNASLQCGSAVLCFLSDKTDIVRDNVKLSILDIYLGSTLKNLKSKKWVNDLQFPLYFFQCSKIIEIIIFIRNIAISYSNDVFKFIRYFLIVCVPIVSSKRITPKIIIFQKVFQL